MIRFLNFRSLFSLALLLLATAALASSLNASMEGMSDTGFLSLAVITLVTAYLLGFGTWPSYRSWMLILFLGPPLIMLQVTHTGHSVGQIILHFPVLLINNLTASPAGQPVVDPFFEAQLDEFFNHLGVFMAGLTTDSHGPGPGLLELLWSFPLFLACAWAGWWSSHRNSILTALIPLLALQALALNVTDRLQGPTLQISAFALIVLMGLHQKWGLSKSEGKTQGQVHLETYARVFILASVLALAAGFAPIIPAPKQVTKTPEAPPPNQIIATRVVQNNPTPSFELPQQHPINTPPPNTLSVVFLASVANEPPLGGNESAPPHYYWRSLTYDRYDGKGWSSSPGQSASYSANQPLFEFNGQGYRSIHQTILKASAGDNQFYWVGSLVDADQPISVTWRTRPPGENPLLSMDMLGALIRAQQYSADSLLPQSTETQLRAASQAYPPEIMEKYLPLPNAISQRVRDLAVTLTANAQNPYDKARAIETYLRTYPYTLDVPAVPANREIADYFLFEIKKGYCDYYATSMAVLARAAGLPARIVIGYTSSEYDAQNKQYVVRGANAHSWVEIYFPDLGWIEFEPTANQPLRERPLSTTEPSGTATPAPTATAVPPPTPNRDDITYEKHGHFVESHSTSNILKFILAIIVICLGYLYVQGLRFTYKTIGSMYKYIYHHGKKIHRGAPLNETPSLFAEKLTAKLRMNHRFILPAADELEQLTALYLRETYSPHPVTRVEQKEAVKTWRRLFWRLLYVRMIQRFGRGAET